MAVLTGIQAGPSMNDTIARFVIVAMLVLPTVAKAQAGSATPISSAVASLPKIGVINVQSAIVATNDGQRDLQALEKRFEPKKKELQSLNDDIDTLKKQVDTQGTKLNDEARANLVRQIDSKQKSLSRSQEDAQNDFGSQQSEIVQKILQKLVPVVDKYAKDNGLVLIMDGTKPWPEWPVLWASSSIDITKAVVDIYNANAEVPATPSIHPSSGASRPVNPSPKKP
jgi:outer membrane protein